ncbi:threonine synthase [Natronosalvus rutilus]|uniref:Threonine synthase n=1 Tax=Natronosalvus rutilus TaxID=2953753 RepID=A0A9E7N8W2_9EURY|nr:threonine synthase [Natronosalvus rutilus]UTF52654.1 threonine synthase [Natronosalvus rutilus]
MTNTNSVVSHFECYDCGSTYDLEHTEFPCPECGGILDPKYDYEAIDVSREEIEARNGSMWKYRELLPILDTDDIVSMGEGNTPIVECPALAEEMGVARVAIKDEGQNPTNTFKDRGASASVSGASQQGIREVAIPSAGNAGQAAAAYTARAGIDCTVVLNYQSNDIQKTMVEAHGADLHLVDGKLDKAGGKFGELSDENGWYTVATFQTPFRHEGKKTMGLELFEQYGWGSPDEIFYPTGGGVGLIGIWKAYQELAELGWLEDETPPSLNVAQSKGCAPVVDAIEEHREEHEAWDCPESIGRGIEVPDPGASPWMLEAVYETGGTGVAVSDSEALDGAIAAARHAGIEMCVEPGAALAAAMQMAEEGELDEDDEILIINTGAGNKATDALSYALN